MKFSQAINEQQLDEARLNLVLSQIQKNPNFDLNSIPAGPIMINGKIPSEEQVRAEVNKWVSDSSQGGINQQSKERVLSFVKQRNISSQPKPKTSTFNSKEFTPSARKKFLGK